MSYLNLLVATGALLLMLTSCTGERPVDDTPGDAPAPPGAGAEGTSPAARDSLRVELLDAVGAAVGTAFLRPRDGGVELAIHARGLPPGPKGFHIHENGVCEGPSFQTAGGHFNPTGRQHGRAHPDGPHAGDLPNLEVRADGTADTVVVAAGVTLAGGQPNSLQKEGGTSLVVHAQPDDDQSQPAGNAGDRIACGVIAVP
jgi:Cu-Zn family superoxide dismutase